MHANFSSALVLAAVHAGRAGQVGSGKPKRLVSVLALGNLNNRHQRDFEVERKTPVVNIPEIKLEPFFDVSNGAGSSAEAVDLGPSGNARLDVVSIGIVGD